MLLTGGAEHLHHGAAEDQGGEGPSEVSDDVSASDSADDNDSQPRGVFLKSGADEAHVMTLNNEDTNCFGTDKLTGCSLVIGGDREAPTIMHANVQNFPS